MRLSYDYITVVVLKTPASGNTYVKVLCFILSLLLTDGVISGTVSTVVVVVAVVVVRAGSPAVSS